MNISRLFLPLALLCSVPSAYLFSMEIDANEQECVWVKDATFPAPRNKKQTQSRWIQVPAQPELLQSKLAESVSLGQMSNDESNLQKQNIQEAFEKRQAILKRDYDLQNCYTKAAVLASIKALTKQRDLYNSGKAIAPSLVTLEDESNNKQKDALLKIIASNIEARIIDTEAIAAHIDPNYVREYKTIEQAQKEESAKAKKSWWSIFSLASK